jgi:hypothetical protein
MMMSMAGEKGSMLFGRSGAGMTILTLPLTASIVRCDRLSRIEPGARSFRRARDAQTGAFERAGPERLLL